MDAAGNRASLWRESRDQAGAARDWATLGERIVRAALVATTIHLAERSAGASVGGAALRDRPGEAN